ncbi:metallophosphoesterase [Haloferula sp.]|uniref:metallophosphoesterase n=1 Tax=Haloferula sp. TaxID=2497595 RepID=UPI0032A0B8A5
MDPCEPWTAKAGNMPTQTSIPPTVILFLLAFIALYGGLNAYLYWSIISGLGEHSLPLVLALTTLVLVPLFVRAFQKSRSGPLLSLIAVLGLYWMGISFIFASISLCIDLIQWIAPTWTNAEALPWLLGIGSAMTLYGFFEARKVGVCRLQVRSPKLPAGTNLRIVQITDLHLGHGTTTAQVRRVIDLIQAQKPDLVVSTGDLFDSNLENLDRHAALLKDLEPPLGKIAVTGNHECYEDLDRAIELTEQAGFTVLRDRSIKASPALCIAGVDDPEALRGRSMDEAERIALTEKSKDAFTVLLKHRPDINSSTVDDFELQLSGHTHGGQIFPFIYLTRLQYRHPHGLSKVAAQTYLFLSRGTGSWGPKIRILAQPAITVIDLERGENLDITVK